MLKPTSTQPIVNPPSRWQLAYDSVMMVLIVLDLLLMGVDALLMSSFIADVANWAGVGGWLAHYRADWHPTLKLYAGFFTVFLIVELLVRWLIAIGQKRYYRWFFFPFVHWYEVLGCAPQLRALRLLRVLVMGYRLHQLGYRVLPNRWLKTGKFYYRVVMEEISDRVILTAIDNIRVELRHADGHLVHDIIDKHRDEIRTVIVELLQQEVTPLLRPDANKAPAFAKPLANQVGTAIQQALIDTPELRRAMRMIPIAGSLIESQMLTLGQHIGENLTLTLSQNLTEPGQLDQLYQQIATGITSVDTTSPALERLISGIIEESLDALANQVKIQQWKHQAPISA